MRPLPFITVPIYRAKGFKDSTSDRVEGGKLKFAIRVLPLMETDVEPELLEKEEEKPLIQTETREGKTRAQGGDGEGLRVRRGRRGRDDAPETVSRAATPHRRGTIRASSAGDHGASLRGSRKDLRPLDPSGLCDPYLGWSCRARGNASAAATITSRRRSRRGSTRCSSLTPSFPGVRSCNSSSWTGTRAGATT